MGQKWWGANRSCEHVLADFPLFRPTGKCPSRTKKGKQSFYTKVQAGKIGEKGKQSFCTKETAPPNPYSLEKTGARDDLTTGVVTVSPIGEPPEKVEFEGKRARPKIFPRPPDSTI